MWVLDFVQERFHKTSLEDFERMFTKAGDKGTKEELRVEEATGERLDVVLL